MVWKARTGRRGAILVGVLWILVFLGFLAVVLRIHTSSVVASVRVTEEKAAARIIAEAGLARAAGLVLAGPFNPEREIGDQLQDTFETATGRVSILVTNEALRVDLNTAEKPLIVGVMRAAGASPALAETLATNVVGLRPKSVEPPPPPAPEGAQTVAPSADAGTSGTLQTVAQVALIDGMPEAVAIGLARLSTVSSGLTGVRLASLDDEFLRSIPDIPPGAISAIKRYRSGEISKEQRDEALAPVTYNSNEKASAWRVRLSVELPSGHAETHEALIMISPDDDAPYRILDWRRVTDGLN